MKISAHVAVILTAASLCCAQASGQVVGQGLSAEAKSKDVAEARAKRNAQTYQNKASILTLLDRYGKQTGKVGERAIYDSALLSPDAKRVAAIKEDLDNESADLFVLEVATGKTTRLTTSARTEFISAAIWSPDSKRLAYVAMRAGKESVFVRAANGKGPEELLYNNPGAFMDLSDWSQDGRFLTFSISDIKGGALYVLSLEGGPDRKPVEIFHGDLRIFEAR